MLRLHPRILHRFEQILEQLTKHGAEILHNVEYPNWTPAVSPGTLDFVWSELGRSKFESLLLTCCPGIRGE